jgi:hypothetical protein
MAQVSGITIEQNYRGTPTFIKFDYKKYGELLQSFFIKHDIELPHVPNEQTLKAMKEAKSKKLKTYLNVDKFIDDLLK